ncbi:MAG: hypothetical protein IJB24_00430 [Clostridia bacterium]|nr:hypothetical protein [Clostridia bacterium]
MTRIILCEGETDLVLISYYLERTKGWVYTGNPKGLKLNFTEQDNKAACNYRNNNDELLICAVGGKDNFGNFFNENLKKPILRSTAGETEYKIALVTDRDDVTIKEIEHSISEQLSPIVNNIGNNIWKTNRIDADLGAKVTIEFLLLVIPKESTGVLETVLMEALSQDKYDANIIEKCGQFVTNIKPDADRYIHENRLQLKAQLGVAFSIFNPEKTFSLFKERLVSVRWEDSPNLAKCFEKLVEI